MPKHHDLKQNCVQYDVLPDVRESGIPTASHKRGFECACMLLCLAKEQKCMRTWRGCTFGTKTFMASFFHRIFKTSSCISRRLHPPHSCAAQLLPDCDGGPLEVPPSAHDAPVRVSKAIEKGRKSGPEQPLALFINS